jgi:hypothetical protein
MSTMSGYPAVSAASSRSIRRPLRIVPESRIRVYLLYAPAPGTSSRVTAISSRAAPWNQRFLLRFIFSSSFINQIPTLLSSTKAAKLLLCDINCIHWGNRWKGISHTRNALVERQHSTSLTIAKRSLNDETRPLHVLTAVIECKGDFETVSGSCEGQGT